MIKLNIWDADVVNMDFTMQLCNHMKIECSTIEDKNIYKYFRNKYGLHSVVTQLLVTHKKTLDCIYFSKCCSKVYWEDGLFRLNGKLGIIHGTFEPQHVPNSFKIVKVGDEYFIGN